LWCRLAEIAEKLKLTVLLKERRILGSARERRLKPMLQAEARATS
jgi:hypothetical protein